MRKVRKSEEQWKAELGPERYRIMRRKGTEPTGSGEHLYNKDPGTYRCAACGAELFRSETKYDSGSGWPSFYAAADEEHIREEPDTSHGMRRTEILCEVCDGHLGHVFPDGPEPTGTRYCVNSASLRFEPDRERS